MLKINNENSVSKLGNVKDMVLRGHYQVETKLGVVPQVTVHLGLPIITQEQVTKKTSLKNWYYQVIKQGNTTYLTNQFTHQLMMNVDCLKALKQIPSNSLDMVITDPPYQLTKYNTKALKKSYHKALNNDPRQASIYKSNLDIANMSNGFPIKKVLDQFVRITKHVNMDIWCSQEQLYGLLTYAHSLPISRRYLRCPVVTWNKTNPYRGKSHHFDGGTEYCIVIYDNRYIHIKDDFNTGRLVYTTPTNNERQHFGYDHPTIKPLFITRNLIYDQTNPNNTVLDPFAGSGTSGCGAKMLNRNFIGMELMSKYYKLSIQRIKNPVKFDERVVKYEINRLKKNRTYYIDATRADSDISDATVKNVIQQKIKGIKQQFFNSVSNAYQPSTSNHPKWNKKIVNQKGQQKPIQHLHSKLTKHHVMIMHRNRKIMKLNKNHTHKWIAKQFGLKVPTINNLISQLRKKLA